MTSVEVVGVLSERAAAVARLRVGFADGRAPRAMIGKRGAGAAFEELLRERCFFEAMAPGWDSSAPQLLGAADGGAGAEAWSLLLMEDLAEAGYALLAEHTPAQLQGVADRLVALHARFWERGLGEHPELARSTGTVTRASQAWPPAMISAHARLLRAEAAAFLQEQAAELTAADTALLEEVLAGWEERFVERAAAGQAITLLHGDFHLLGNIFFAPDLPLPRIIDWSEIKPGLGPHDLAYALVSAPSSHRVARDLALLRRYHEGLLTSGVGAYSWELCHWDYRFSLLTNLFQSVFQRSAFWFRKTAAVAAEHDALAALRSPPPPPPPPPAS